MKFIRIVGSLLPLALLLPVLCLAQGSAQTDDIAKLREQIAAQQKQLDQQRQALEAAQKAIDSQQKLLDRLGGRAGRAGGRSSAIRGAAPTAAPAAEVDIKGRAFSPLAFHIGGADFAPGGFMDFVHGVALHQHRQRRGDFLRRRSVEQHRGGQDRRVSVQRRELARYPDHHRQPHQEPDRHGLCRRGLLLETSRPVCS